MTFNFNMLYSLYLSLSLSLSIYIYIYPVRCAHIPPPCHFSVCSDFLVCLTARVLIFISKVIKFSIIFEARAVIFEARTVILEARGAIWTISGRIVIFNRKKSFDSLPPGMLKIHFLRSREVAVFVECSRFWIFVILSAQTFILASIWTAFGEHWASRKTVESV